MSFTWENVSDGDEAQASQINSIGNQVAATDAEMKEVQAALRDRQLLETDQPDILRKHQKTVTGYSYAAVPNNASGGVEAVLSGLTLENELNYTRDTWAEWTLSASASADATGLTLVGNGTQYIVTYVNTAFKPSTKYGALYNIKSVNLSSNLYGGNVFSTPALTKNLGNNKAVLTSISSISQNRWTFQISSSETSSNSIKIKDIRVFELPSGSEIESDFTDLTADELTLKYPYIKGGEVRNAGPQRVRSVGKSLFDKNKAILGYEVNYSIGGIVVSSTSFTSAYIPVKESASYTFSWQSGSGDVKIEYLDNNKNFISGVRISTVNSYGTRTTPSNAKYLRFSSGLTLIDVMQLELGSTATPYEAYRGSAAFVPEIGRRLPNGAADEIDLNTGKKTQNVSEAYTLQAGDIYGINTTAFTNIDLVWVYKQTDYLYYNMANETTGTVTISGYREKSSAISDSTSDIGYFSGRNNVLYFGLCVAKGAYADLAAAQAALAGTVIYYQLAEPVETDVHIRGGKDFKVYPSGTVYTEPALWGYLTASPTTVTTSDRPIKSIRSVIRFDVENGELIETDVTDDASTSDNLSLTVADFDETKTYFYDCEYDTQYSLNPEISLGAEVDNGVISHDFGAAATAWTLTANEALATYLSCTNAGGGGEHRRSGM